MTEQKMNKLTELFAKLSDVSKEWRDFTQESAKEFKRYETRLKKLQTSSSSGRKLKPFEFSENIRLEIDKMKRQKIEDNHEQEEENDTTVVQRETERHTSARPKRRAAEKAEASVKKGFEFESIKKLRRPEPEPEKSSHGTTYTEMTGNGNRLQSLRSTLPTIVGSPSARSSPYQSLKSGRIEEQDPPNLEVTVMLRQDELVEVIGGSSNNKEHINGNKQLDVSPKMLLNGEIHPQLRTVLLPTVVMNKLSGEDILRHTVPSDQPVGPSDVFVERPPFESVRSSKPPSFKRTASESIGSPSLPKKKSKFSKKITGSLIATSVEDSTDVVRSLAVPRATRSRTKVRNKPSPTVVAPTESVEVSDKSSWATGISGQRNTRSSRTESAGKDQMFKTPMNLNFAVGTAYTTGGLKIDKENACSKIILSSGRKVAKVLQPLKNHNKQIISGTGSAKVPSSAKTVENRPKHNPANKEALNRDRDLKIKLLAAKRAKELQAKAKSERDAEMAEKQRKAEVELRLKQMQLEKKRLNDIKAQKAEKRRLEQEAARNARIEQQNEEARKAAEMRQKELAEAEKLQQQRKKLEKERSAKPVPKVLKLIPTNKANDIDDIGLHPTGALTKEDRQRVAKWADFKSVAFQEVNHAQGMRPEITMAKARLMFQRPHPTPDVQKIFGLFARVRPRTSSACWNETIALPTV